MNIHRTRRQWLSAAILIVLWMVNLFVYFVIDQKILRYWAVIGLKCARWS